MSGNSLSFDRPSEELEAQAAADMVERSDRELAHLQHEIARFEAEVADLGNTNAALISARAALTAEMQTAYPHLAHELSELESEAAEMRSSLIELREAASAGERALEQLSKLEGQLRKAKSASTYDTWLGGGMLASMYKRDQIKMSSELSRSVAQAMAAFDRELGDTQVDGITVELDLALANNFFDVWFDNFFTDLRIQANIKSAQADAASVRARVDEILIVLDTSTTSTQQRIGEFDAAQIELLSRPQDSL